MGQSCFFIATSWGAKAVPDQFFALAHELSNRGHRVVILVDGQQQEAENHLANPAIYTWPSLRPTHLHDAFFLYRLIRKHQPCALVSNFGATNLMMLLGRLMKVRCRVAWYHTLTSAVDIDREMLGIKLRLLRFRKRLVYDWATHLVPVSDAARLDLQLNFHVPPHKCRVFYNSLLDPLTTSSSAETRDNGICLGRFWRTKGQDVLLQALALLNGEAPAVDFIGEGPAKSALIRQTHELGLDRKCRFFEPVSHETAIAKIASAKMTLLPSRSDNCPLVAIESLAVGTPIIASRVGGIGEIIRDGLDGFLVPPNNPEVLASKIRILTTDAALRNTLSQNARKRFLEKFEQRRNVKAQADWLENITS